MAATSDTRNTRQMLLQLPVDALHCCVCHHCSSQRCIFPCCVQGNRVSVYDADLSRTAQELHAEGCSVHSTAVGEPTLHSVGKSCPTPAASPSWAAIPKQWLMSWKPNKVCGPATSNATHVLLFQPLKEANWACGYSAGRVLLLTSTS